MFLTLFLFRLLEQNIIILCLPVKIFDAQTHDLIYLIFIRVSLNVINEIDKGILKLELNEFI